MILSALVGHSQDQVEVYVEELGSETVFMADNQEYCPVTVLMDLRLQNMNSSAGNKIQVVLPARSKGVELTRLSQRRAGSTKYQFDFQMFFGGMVDEHGLQEHLYDLPFETGGSFRIGQGYFGKQTHQHSNSLDFEMPIGTKVVAARAGVVVKVVEHNSKGCPSNRCADHANSILLYHGDGSFTEYVHLAKNGSLVAVGETVEQGQLIGLSGNTGWTSGPHLHFTVFCNFPKGKETYQTSFKINDGNEVTVPKEFETYSKRY